MTKYLVTGTRVYGPVRKDSDLDIVMYYWEAEEIKNFLKNNYPTINITETDQHNSQYRSFYIEFLDIKINIIVVTNEEEYNCWRQATEKMKKIRPIHNRRIRIEKFQQFFNGGKL